MRCDDACPSSVPLSQMHNEARGQFVESQMEKLSREYVRNRILSNYHFSRPSRARCRGWRTPRRRFRVR